MATSEEERLYRLVGERIRAARQRSAGKLSQQALAKRLGVSRTSVVNIEQGRQHPPLHVLWKIAEVLDTELSQLIPHRSELLEPEANTVLTEAMLQQIKDSASTAAAEGYLTAWVGQLRQLIADPTDPTDTSSRGGDGR